MNDHTIERALEDLGERLSLLRRARGMTQSDLAGQIGVSLSSLVSLEKGRPGVAIGTLVRALQGLDHLEDVHHLADPMGDPEVMETGLRNVPKRAK